MGRQRGEGLLAAEELPFLKKDGVATGPGLVAQTSKAGCSTLPVVPWYVSGTRSRAGFNRAPNKGAWG